MTILETRLVTEEEFLGLPETVEKIELVDGEVVVAPSPSFWHQEVLARVVFALREWAGNYRGPVTIGQAPLDVRFGDGRILQPDAFVLFAPVEIDHQGPLSQVPEICIEVLSKNRSYDRLAKRLIYAEAGVQEYWIVDPVGKVEQWLDGLTRARTVDVHLTSTRLPGFTLDLEKLFESPGEG
jgi:Uma2 family endonuclease